MTRSYASSLAFADAPLPSLKVGAHSRARARTYYTNVRPHARALTLVEAYISPLRPSHARQTHKPRHTPIPRLLVVDPRS